MSTAADSESAPATDGTTPGRGEGSGPGSDCDDAAYPSAVSPPAPPGAVVTPPGASAPSGLVFDDPLDRPSSDDTDRGWGDSPSASADDDFTRFLSEKPPHHL